MYFWLTVFSPHAVTVSLGSLSTNWKYPHLQNTSWNDFRGLPCRRSLTPRLSPLRAPVLSFTHYFRAPATQASNRLKYRIWAPFCVWVLFITEFLVRQANSNKLFPWQSDCKSHSPFENYPLLFGTHNRFYMSQSGLKEPGQAKSSLLCLLNNRDASLVNLSTSLYMEEGTELVCTKTIISMEEDTYAY